MHQLSGRHAAVVDARVPLLEDHDATALDPGSALSTAAVVKLANPMLVMNRPRFST